MIPSIWVEKYRPTMLADVIFQSDAQQAEEAAHPVLFKELRCAVDDDLDAFEDQFDDCARRAGFDHLAGGIEHENQVVVVADPASEQGHQVRADGELPQAPDLES